MTLRIRRNRRYGVGRRRRSHLLRQDSNWEEFMGRRFVVLAALAAVMFSMAACRCATRGGGGGATSKDAACVTTCVHHRDCTACYRDESDRDMARLVDCLPCGGSCDGCTWTTRTCEERFHGFHAAPCDR
jgi:hypothetical protein